jgi:F0F1-type ATP synthase membrane subunit c/vacuolar-type H+-ATPase subunit K
MDPDKITEKPSTDAHTSGVLVSRVSISAGEAIGLVALEQVEPVAEYPAGFRLYIMVVALVLSIFLISLDMVSLDTRGCQGVSSLTFADNRSYGNPCNHRRISRSRRCSVVWSNIFHDGQRLSIHMGQDVQIFSTEDKLPYRHFGI